MLQRRLAVGAHRTAVIPITVKGCRCAAAEETAVAFPAPGAPAPATAPAPAQQAKQPPPWPGLAWPGLASLVRLPPLPSVPAGPPSSSLLTCGWRQMPCRYATHRWVGGWVGRQFGAQNQAALPCLATCSRPRNCANGMQQAHRHNCHLHCIALRCAAPHCTHCTASDIAGSPLCVAVRLPACRAWSPRWR